MLEDGAATGSSKFESCKSDDPASNEPGASKNFLEGVLVSLTVGGMCGEQAEEKICQGSENRTATVWPLRCRNTQGCVNDCVRKYNTET